jgi:hypothetical protein
MAVLEFMVAGEFTALGFTVAADFQAAGSTVGLAVSTGELLDLPTADFTTANFKLTDFTARGSIIVASTAAWSWPLPSVGCGWAPGWAALITLFQTKSYYGYGPYTQYWYCDNPAGYYPLWTAMQHQLVDGPRQLT